MFFFVQDVFESVTSVQITLTTYTRVYESLDVFFSCKCQLPMSVVKYFTVVRNNLKGCQQSILLYVLRTNLLITHRIT